MVSPPRVGGYKSSAVRLNWAVVALIAGLLEFLAGDVGAAEVSSAANVEAVASYVTADVRFAWRPTANLELSLVGQNLLEARHPEQTSTIGTPTIEVPRGFYGKVTWRF